MSTLGWISSFQSDLQTISYESQASFSGEIIVQSTSENESPYFSDCSIDMVTMQCEYRSAIFSFHSPQDSIMHISLILVGNDKILLMPTNQGGVTDPIVSYSASDDLLRQSYRSFFTVSLIPDYLHNGRTKEALEVVHLTRRTYFDNVLPPKRFVIVKGSGFVEWEDYNGNTYSIID
jgi:hypothetical protein